jgi:signal transduction histidine kinase
MKDFADASAQGGSPPRPARAEADLASLRRELDHTHQLATLGTLTAGIAHEINNLLTPVLAYAQMARANPHDEALKAKAVNKAISGVEAASRIIEAVLGFAQSADNTARANVAKVVESSLACLGRPPQREGVSLSVAVDPHAEVRMQPLALQQVLLNLVLNAIAALRNDGGELRIDVARDPRGTTRIRVADNGPGIPQELAARLFEPFVSGRPRHGSGDGPGAQGGSGLGLAICHRLVEEAGGSIEAGPGWFESEMASGPGATFTIILPTFAEDGEQKAA